MNSNPSFKQWRIPAGTKCQIRRASDSVWRDYTTKADVFLSRPKVIDKLRHFLFDGWEIRVAPGGYEKPKRHPLKEYGDRNRRLRKHDIATSYAEYLRSPEWKALRIRVLKRDRGKCQCCGGKADQVHHVKYTNKTLKSRATYWLFSICRDCHKYIEFKPDGTKRRMGGLAIHILHLRRENGLTTSTSRYLQNLGTPRSERRKPWDKRKKP